MLNFFAAVVSQFFNPYDWYKIITLFNQNRYHIVDTQFNQEENNGKLWNISEVLTLQIQFLFCLEYLWELEQTLGTG